MKKQTKLVAVLSTASLLAIGASMTSFAATGWAEEDGTWVYYNRDGERATESWKKSGNNWYYLDSNGEMAVDQLIEDGDNYYYVDANGVMASNQWVAIDNEDAGEDDEPEHYWYYFQANGKALNNGNNTKVALKTINGKKYAFDDEGKMLYGWVNKESAERLDDTDGNAFTEGDYYFGSEDDGAMTTGWLLMDITYDGAEDDYEIAPVFNDDEDQSRWFYFQSNGKKIKADNGDEEKEKTINGRKYAFDKYGAMIAEWSLDVDQLNEIGTPEGSATKSYPDWASHSDAASGSNSVDRRYAEQWRYFSSVEDGARISRGWFKVVPAEWLNEEKYDDDEDAWYYADGSGNLYAGEFKTIKGKKYAFRDDGRMVTGLKFIKEDGGLSVKADDDDDHPFDTEANFLKHSMCWNNAGYDLYYFGGDDDGEMRTNKANIDIDGDTYNFFFGKSGSKKGKGLTEIKDDKFYQAGMLLKADKDVKYQVVVSMPNKVIDENNEEKILNNNYTKYDDALDFMRGVGECVYGKIDGKIASDGTKYKVEKITTQKMANDAGINKKLEDLDEAYAIVRVNEDDEIVGYGTLSEFALITTSGKIVDTNSKNKDGNDFNYVVKKGTIGSITAIYTLD